MKLRYPVKNFQRLTCGVYLGCRGGIDMCLDMVCETWFVYIIYIFLYIKQWLLVTMMGITLRRLECLIKSYLCITDKITHVAYRGWHITD